MQGVLPQNSQHVAEGAVLLLEPERAKDFTLPSHSRLSSIAPECRLSEKTVAPAFHKFVEPSNDSVLRPRLAPVCFDTMQGHPESEAHTYNCDGSAEESAAEPGPGDYDPLVWLQVCSAAACQQVPAGMRHPLAFTIRQETVHSAGLPI